ncbi:galactose mutarotase [Luminiphilus sp.]|nr:galactose mutarotase [Luminiphilus sp.]
MTEQYQISSKTNSDSAGMTVNVLSQGASITGMTVQLAGKSRDVVLGYSSAEDYASDPFYMGSTVGPVANRLRDGKFSIASESYTINVNEVARSNLLHGGARGLHQQPFKPAHRSDDRSLEMSVKLAHLEDGFPGDRTITVRYVLVDPLSLQIDFFATTSQPTVMNLASHPYFNLGGPLGEHALKMNAKAFNEVDDRLLPTGALHSVVGTTLSFQDWRTLDNTPIDHNFVLSEDSTLRHAASLRLASSNLQLDLLTTQAALQIYTGDDLSAPFTPRAGICMEAQGFPDAPNQATAPSIDLMPGQIYRHKTLYRFGHIAEK